MAEASGRQIPARPSAKVRTDPACGQSSARAVDGSIRAPFHSFVAAPVSRPLPVLKDFCAAPAGCGMGIVGASGAGVGALAVGAARVSDG